MSQNEDCTGRRSVKDRRSTIHPKIRNAGRCLEEVIIERRSFRPRHRLAEGVARSVPLDRDGLSDRVVAASFADHDAHGVDLGEHSDVRTPARPSRTFGVVWAHAGFPDRLVVDHAREFASHGFLRSADALGITVLHRPGFRGRRA